MRAKAPARRSCFVAACAAVVFLFWPGPEPALGQLQPVTFGAPVVLEEIHFPAPVISQALMPDRTTDETGDVHDREHECERAEEPVQLVEPRGCDRATEQLRAQQQTPRDRCREEHPRDDPTRARHVPPQLLVHRALRPVAASQSAATAAGPSTTSSPPPSWTITPSGWVTRPSRVRLSVRSSSPERKVL